MARSAADAALMLSAIAGPDPRAPLSLPEPGEVFRKPLERDFGGVRVAWSADFGGVPFDPRVPAALAPARGALEAIGCGVEDADPDLSGAAEAFDRWRAWYFELNWGPLLDRHREAMKDTVIWNIEQGRGLSASALAEATHRWTALLRRVRAFFERYEFFVLPVSQVPPFDVEVRVSDRGGRGADEDLYRLDGVLRLDFAARLSRRLGPLRLHPGGTPGRPPDRRPPA